MKKVIGIILIVALLGGGIYWGYSTQQRKKIDTWLEEEGLVSCNPAPRKDKTPAQNWLKKQTCLLVEEQNEEMRKAAKESKTYKEFRQKIDVLVEKWEQEGKLDKLIEQSKRYAKSR